MSESWEKYCCEQCSSVNWYCFGDTNDCTAYTPDLLRCHKCAFEFPACDGLEGEWKWNALAAEIPLEEWKMEYLSADTCSPKPSY